jgi:cell division protein FtsB
VSPEHSGILKDVLMFLSFSSLSAMISLAVSLVVAYHSPEWKKWGILVGLFGLTVTIIVGIYEKSTSDAELNKWEIRHKDQKDRADRLDSAMRALPRMEGVIGERFEGQLESERNLLAGGQLLNQNIVGLQKRNGILLQENARLNARIDVLRGQLNQITETQQGQNSVLAEQQQATQERRSQEAAAQAKRAECESIAGVGGNMTQRNLDAAGCAGWKPRYGGQQN